MFARRSLILQLLLISLLGIGCESPAEFGPPKKLTIGVVSYGNGKVSLDKYERFQKYIASETYSIVELEPAYNELQAIDQIRRKRWHIVFAPPGLAAIAIGKQLYEPMFSMGDVSSKQRSIIIVRDDSSIQKIADLANKTVALGQKGSAAGYYVPLYDLYGLTLSGIRSAPTPQTLMEWVNEGSADAGALSEKDYEIYRRSFRQTKFRIIHTSRWIPPGVVILAPTVELNRQRQIEIAMNQAPANITADANYVPSAKIPSYKKFIELIEKVKPLEAQIQETPVVLVPKVSTPD